ncbi:MAG: cellulase family glycosylhydrolase [Alphaproteobacteria bacterium]
MNTGVWADADAQAGWVAMWQATAEAYRGNPAVVGYDLMVEPNSNHLGADAVAGRLEVWEPETFAAQYGGTLYDWNGLHPRILAAIRAVDPDMPVLIGGNGYSAVGWLPFTAVGGDAHTVYTVHEYEPFAYTHQEPGDGVGYPGTLDIDWDGAADRFDAGGIDRLLAPVDGFMAAHDAPVAVTEFGAVRWAPGVAPFLADRIATFERRGLNWTVWNWPVAYAPTAAGDNAFSPGFGPDPDRTAPASDAPALDALRAGWRANAARPSNTHF